jgi:Ca2+/Na+ antiporter
MFAAFYKRFRENLHQYALEAPYIFLVIAYFFIVWIPMHVSEWILVWVFLLAFLPFVLPTLFAVLLVHTYLEYRRQKQYWETEHVVLEVRLPEEITQSPYSMELVLRALYDTGEVDTPAHEWQGNTRPWFSLEMVSNEGAVRFYVWMRAKFEERIKAQLYAHYPTVQVARVEDYTLQVPWDSGEYDLWGIEQKLQKPDPYPIATYVEQGMTKPDLKEEFKHDPMASLI